jgi:hypothetical protein
MEAEYLSELQGISSLLYGVKCQNISLYIVTAVKISYSTCAFRNVLFCEKM